MTGIREEVFGLLPMAVLVLCLAGLGWLVQYAIVPTHFGDFDEGAYRAHLAADVASLHADGCRLVALDLNRNGRFICRELTRQEYADVTAAWRADQGSELP